MPLVMYYDFPDSVSSVHRLHQFNVIEYKQRQENSLNLFIQKFALI
jgi:hypothetical protein